MFRKLSALVLIVGMLFIIGCASHVHKVGEGAQGASATKARQWYVLWGLVPVNDVDTQTMAEGATDYEIMTEHNFVDIIVSSVLGSFTVYCRSVTVRK